MRFNWKMLLFIFVTVVMTTLMVIKAQQTPLQPESIDVSKFPVLDYANQRPLNENERAIREARSKKYNSRYAPRISESSDQIYAINDWEVGLPAFPVTKSSAVIIGEIIDAQAQLSADQTNIYSEFVVRADSVLKNDVKNPLKMTDAIIVERLGGRVRFPSGKVVVSMVNHQDMPRVGGRYVLFLTHNFPMGGEYDKDLLILTGYELRGGRVFPLDKTVPGHPIAIYKGIDEKSFMKDLASALENNFPTLQSQ